MNKYNFDKRKLIILSFMFFVFFLIDVISKHLAVVLLPYKKISLINNFVYLIYYENDEGTFGMLGGLDYSLRVCLILCIALIIISSLLILITKTWKFNKVKNFLPIILMMNAAIGNSLDLIVRGYVVDFIQICYNDRTLVVCNFADIYATSGWILFLILYPIYPNILYLKRKNYYET